MQFDRDALHRAQLMAESAGNPNAISPVGAMGLMQVMPDTARQPGFGLQRLANPMDPKANEAFGRAYMDKMLGRYKNDPRRALAAYNWGAGNADKWDGNVNSLPAETRNYIAKIMPQATQPGGQQAIEGVAPAGEAQTPSPAMAPQQVPYQSPLSPPKAPEASPMMPKSIFGLSTKPMDPNTQMGRMVQAAGQFGQGLLSGNGWGEGVSQGLANVDKNVIAPMQAQQRVQQAAGGFGLNDQQTAALGLLSPEQAGGVLAQQAFPRATAPTELQRNLQLLPQDQRQRAIEIATGLSPRAAAPSGGPSYSKTPVYGTDESGNTVLGTIGSDGSFKKIDTGGFNVANGLDKIDTGTEIITRDKRTGDVINVTQKDLAGAERQKVTGKIEGTSQAEASTQLTQTLATAEDTLRVIDSILDDPALERGTGLSSTFNAVPGTQGFDFQQKANQLQGKAFLQAFESLKGGGQITEPEGRKATEAIASLSTGQSEKAYRRSLGELREIVLSGIRRAREKAGKNTQASPSSSPKVLTYNPETGELE